MERLAYHSHQPQNTSPKWPCLSGRCQLCEQKVIIASCMWIRWRHNLFQYLSYWHHRRSRRTQRHFAGHERCWCYYVQLFCRFVVCAQLTTTKKKGADVVGHLPHMVVSRARYDFCQCPLCIHFSIDRCLRHHHRAVPDTFTHRWWRCWWPSVAAVAAADNDKRPRSPRR